jgi:hypothetical protein
MTPFALALELDLLEGAVFEDWSILLPPPPDFLRLPLVAEPVFPTMALSTMTCGTA